MAWIIIANLKGAPGDAAALGKFQEIEAALADKQAQIDKNKSDIIRTEQIPENRFVVQDAMGAEFVSVNSTDFEPYLDGSTPPNSENLAPAAGEKIEFVDGFGVPLFSLDYKGAVSGNFSETHFVFLVGQSNSVGIGTPSPIGTNNPLPNLFTIPQRGTSQGVEVIAVEPLTHPYANPVSESVGHGWTVARQYALENPGVRVVVVGLAKSGSGFWAPSDPGFSWAPSREGEAGVESLYRNAISRANSAISAYAGPKRVAMFIWHQGEGDAVGGTTQSAYETELIALINGLRAQVTGATEAIFLVGQLGWEFRNVRKPGTYLQIDAAHKNIPNLVRGTAFAPAPEQGYMFEDNTHFSGHGQKLLADSFVSVRQDAYYNL